MKTLSLMTTVVCGLFCSAWLVWADAPPPAPDAWTEGVGTAHKLMYSGVLYASDGGLTTNGATTAWNNAAVRWDVWANYTSAETPAVESFTYQYTIRAGAGSQLSHMIAELTHWAGTEDDPVAVTPASGLISEFQFYDYELDDWVDFVGATRGDPAELQVQDFDTGDGNPGWPAGYTMWGIKFSNTSGFGDGTGTWSFRFDSLQVPTWGDFYLKDGKQNSSDLYAYNQDIGADDPEGLPTDWWNLYASSNGEAGYAVGTPPVTGNPDGYPGAGSIYAIDGFYQVVRADGITIPEPSSGLLAGMLALAGLMSRRQRRQA